MRIRGGAAYAVASIPGSFYRRFAPAWGEFLPFLWAELQVC